MGADRLTRSAYSTAATANSLDRCKRGWKRPTRTGIPGIDSALKVESECICRARALRVPQAGSSKATGHPVKREWLLPHAADGDVY